MNVVLCQTNIIWEDREANFSRIRELLSGVEIPGGSLVVLPEMFSTGFSMHVDRVAEGEPSQVEAFLGELAQRYGAAVLGGLATRAVDETGVAKGRNELLAVAEDGRQLVRYQKIRTFRYGDEHRYYKRGTQVVTFPWGGLSICPLICYDLRFPELFRRGAAMGAQVFVVIASWPSLRVDHWLALLRARAIENQAYVVGVNRCGEDPNWQYPGASVVIDPLGKTVADVGSGEGLAMGGLSVELVEGWRREFPALLDLE